MLEPAMRPHGGDASAARPSHGPIMNGIPPDGEMNGKARQLVSASSFLHIQEKLRAIPVRSFPAAAREAKRTSIPDLPIASEPGILALVYHSTSVREEPAPRWQPPPPTAESEQTASQPYAEADQVDALSNQLEPPQVEPLAEPEPVAETVAVEALAEEQLPPAMEPSAEPDLWGYEPDDVTVEGEALAEEPASPAVEPPPEAEPEETEAALEAPASETWTAQAEEAPAAAAEAVDTIVAAPVEPSPERLTDTRVEEPVIPEPVIEAAPALPEQSDQPEPSLPTVSAELPVVGEAKEGEAEDLLRPLVEKFSGTTALLKKIESEADPFSETSSGIVVEPPAAEEPTEAELIDPQSGEVARSLLDVMSAPSGTSQPQERALAADTLLRLVPRLPLKNLAGLVERVSLMETPPQLLVRRLIRDARIEIAGPLLERASAISDQDLMAVIAEGDAPKQRLIARRRTISPALADAVINAGDSGALLTLVRNPGATFSIESFHRLGELAANMPALQAPLATRLDTPGPVAFELFWALPAELRRYILSRFLTDSETLNRILKIALAVGSGDAGEDPTPEPKFPEKAKVDAFVEIANGSDRPAAAARLAELAGISLANADRIMADREGEPMTVVLKALGLTRARFAEVMDAFRQLPQPLLRSDRNISDLQGIFDSLSFNKARMLLTYWDWAAQHLGPYARSGK